MLDIKCLDIKLPSLLRVRMLSEGSVLYFFLGFSFKDAELHSLVAGGRGSNVFGNFGFGRRSYRGTFPFLQNKAKTKENEAITLSFSPGYHRSHSEETCKRLQALRGV